MKNNNFYKIICALGICLWGGTLYIWNLTNIRSNRYIATPDYMLLNTEENMYFDWKYKIWRNCNIGNITSDLQKEHFLEKYNVDITNYNISNILDVFDRLNTGANIEDICEHSWKYLMQEYDISLSQSLKFREYGFSVSQIEHLMKQGLTPNEIIIHHEQRRQEAIDIIMSSLPCD